MEKKRRLYMAAMTLVAATLLILVLSKYKYLFYNTEEAFAEATDDFRKKSQAVVDDTMKRLHAESSLLDSLKTLIAANRVELADKILDSAILADSSRYIYKTYKGMVYAARGNDSMAIEYYNRSMWRFDFPVALYHRAQSLIRLNKFDSAIADLKTAAETNYDFGVHVAKAYEQNKMIDSAIIYYKKYIQHYPEKEEIALHLDSLVARNK